MLVAGEEALVVAISSSNFRTLLATISDAATVEERIDMESSWYLKSSQGLEIKPLLAFPILQTKTSRE